MQRFEHPAMPALSRAVRVDHAVERRGFDRANHERRRAGYESVQHDDAPSLSGSQDQARDRRDLEAAQSRQNPEGIHVFRAMQRQRPRDRVRLPRDARVVEPRAPPGGFDR